MIGHSLRRYELFLSFGILEKQLCSTNTVSILNITLGIMIIVLSDLSLIFDLSLTIQFERTTFISLIADQKRMIVSTTASAYISLAIFTF